MALTQCCMSDSRCLFYPNRADPSISSDCPVGLSKVSKMSGSKQTGVKPPIRLLDGDFSTLDTGRRINGMVVNAFFRLIGRRARFYEQLTRVTSLSPAFISRWQNGTISDRYLQAVGCGIGTAKLLMVPLNLPCLGPYGHWALLIADTVAGNITAYDPLGYSRKREITSLRNFPRRYADLNPE